MPETGPQSAALKVVVAGGGGVVLDVQLQPIGHGKRIEQAVPLAYGRN